MYSHVFKNKLGVYSTERVLFTVWSRISFSYRSATEQIKISLRYGRVTRAMHLAKRRDFICKDLRGFDYSDESKKDQNALTDFGYVSGKITGTFSVAMFQGK